MHCVPFGMRLVDLATATQCAFFLFCFFLGVGDVVRNYWCTLTYPTYEETLVGYS